MREFPVFIPFGEERLAGVVTLPDDRARGLAMLLQGLGAPRSHKYGLWTRTARALAARGVASLRIDYQSLGDSTGSLLADLHHPPVDEAVAAATVVMDILGVEAIATVGNCMGGRTALAVANLVPGCVSVACILPGNLDAIAKKGAGEDAVGGLNARARRLATRLPRLKRAIRRRQRARGAVQGLRLMPVFPEALRSSPVLLMYIGADDAYQQLRRSLEPLRGKGGDPNPHMALIPAGRITSFRLPIELQTTVIDALAEWIDETMPGKPVRR